MVQDGDCYSLLCHLYTPQNDFFRSVVVMVEKQLEKWEVTQKHVHTALKPY